MLCLFLFSLLIITQAQENFTQELNADIAKAFQNLAVDQNASVNSTAPDLFDTRSKDAEQEYNRAASISHEEIERIFEQFLDSHYIPPSANSFFPYPLW